MKVTYLNAITDGLRSTYDSLFGFVPIKNKTRVESYLHPSFDYVLHFQISGVLQGIFVMSFKQELALKMVKAMTGIEDIEELDENATSCIEEIGNMIKGSIINQLLNCKYQCDIPIVSFMKRNQVVPFPSSILVADTQSDFGEIELHYFIN